MKKHLSISIILLAIGVTAFATTPINNGQPFINAQIGIGGINTGTTTPTDGGYKFSVGGTTSRLSGGYLFTLSPKFSLGPELGYMGYSNNDYSLQTDFNSYTRTVQYSGFTIDLLAVATFHYTKHWYLIGKAGLANVSQTATLLPDSTAVSSTKTSLLPELDAGIGVNFTPHIGIDFNIASTFLGAYPDPFSDTSSTALDEVANVFSVSFGAHYLF